MAYKYFFRTINGQAERLLQSADVSICYLSLITHNEAHSISIQPPSRELTISPVVRDMTLQLVSIACLSSNVINIHLVFCRKRSFHHMILP